LRGLRQVLALVASALVLAGCAASPEQLLLPELNSARTGTAQGAAARKGGVALGSPGNPETAEARVYKGSGEFAGSPDPRPLPKSAGRDGVKISLVDAPIAAAAKAVMGDTLGLNYVVSDKVKGAITLQLTNPVARADLLDMFDAALKAQGAGIVNGGDLYRIVPIEEVVASGSPISGSGATRMAPGRSTQVVTLRYVAAPEMERILKSVAPQGQVVRTDPSRNLVVLAGSRAELQAMNDAISMFDVDWMRGMSFAIFPVDTGDPDSIAQELDQVFANDRDSPTKGIVRFIASRRLKSVLVMSSRPEYLAKAESWIRKIDMAGKASEKQVHVYHVQNRPAGEMAQLLQKIYASQDRSRTQSSLSDPGAAVSLTSPQAPFPASSGATSSNATASASPLLAPQPVTGLPPRAESPSAARGASAAPALEPAAVLVSALDAQGRPLVTGSLPPDDRLSGISIVADETNNSLVITASTAEFKRIKQVLARVDVAPPQIQIEATIAEVTLNDQLKFGVQWFFSGGKNQSKFTDDLAGAVGPKFPGFSYFLNMPNVQVALNALSGVTDVNVVSSPTLMVLDNKKAQLQIGNEVPIATQSAVGVLAPGSPIVNSINFRNTGIILNITPRVSDNGRVLLEIEQEVSDVVATTTSTIDSPTIQQRRVRTTVAVNDGEGVFLAGLMQDRSTRDRTQVPLFGHIPLVGNLFKNKNDTIQRTELLIAITPRVIKDSHESKHVLEEFRDKLNFRTRPQRYGPPDRREQIDRLIR
jgi:general secretion pathway protein D